MPNSELMPIGVFARRSGLTSSALRFYADSGLLPAAVVDPVTGYRYYSPAQVPRATQLRRLREIAMPLTTVETLLAAESDEASRLLDEHVARTVEEAKAAQRIAAVIESSLAGVPSLPIAVLRGPVLADAVEQVLTATVREPGMPVLAALFLEVSQEAVTLTATDRYRLATRTLAPVEPPLHTWAAAVNGDELRTASAAIRRSGTVRIEATARGIRLRLADREDQHCRLIADEAFPDYRLVLASLGEATTRVKVSKALLLRFLEELPGERVALRVTDGAVTHLWAGDGHSGTRLPAAVTGQALRIWFELTTLYPAVSTAIGPDVLLDLRGHDQPVTVRSADRGDLTTLIMPIRPDHIEQDDKENSA
ncbi:MerR family transcriptional regulator [Streptomyces atroolivaceus]|uniref:DNA polymerase III subunit beta family protein n=1 Tax=Streptomyces atroolivaceus TaxID=66869 RepID=UPI003646CDC0